MVYFTIFVNAGKRQTICDKVLEKLNALECPSHGTFRNVFYLANVSNGLNLSFSVILNF